MAFDTSYNSVITGLGCKVEYCTTSGGSYTEVGQLRGIDGTSSEVTMWDSTGLKSDAGEQVPTIFRAGDFGFKVGFDPANTTHDAIHDAHQAKTLLYWKLTFPSPVGPGAVAPGSPKSYNFAAYVKTFATSGYEVESGIEAQITLAITGTVEIV